MDGWTENKGYLEVLTIKLIYFLFATGGNEFKPYIFGLVEKIIRVRSLRW